jgi:hypothetical protein
MPRKKTVQPSPRALASRRNGALGGKARAAKYSLEQRKEWSSKGGKALQELYGSDFKSFMGTKRKKVGRYKTPVEMTKVGKKKRKTSIRTRIAA